MQDQVSNLQDLSVSIHQTATVPGQTSFVFITINNWGPIFSTGYVKLSMEPGLYNLSYSSVPPDSIVGNNYYWGLDSVGFLQSKRINLDLVTVNSATLGVPFLNKVEVFNANNEPNTLNNIGISEGVVLGSFDPNDKQVNPQGQGVNGEINPKDSILTYKIRFQNTGTYKAFNIKVVDTLDINLDISTFTLETYSHPCKVSFLSPRVIEFFFEDIMLPDSATDNRNSHGFIQYTIRTNQSLPFGTQIKNSASIYFDFNEPIYTNQTLNTITTVGLEELEYLGQFFITPNPAKERILIQFVNAEFPGVIRVIDLQGRIILEESYEKGQRQMELDIQNLSNGTYIIQNKNIYSNQSNFFIKM